MRTRDFALSLFLSLSALGVGCWIGGLSGHAVGWREAWEMQREFYETEAIHRGFAHWTVDSEGIAEFTWNAEHAAEPPGEFVKPKSE